VNRQVRDGAVETDIPTAGAMLDEVPMIGTPLMPLHRRPVAQPLD
jgi:hypothetical protein